MQYLGMVIKYEMQYLGMQYLEQVFSQGMVYMYNLDILVMCIPRLDFAVHCTDHHTEICV